MRNLLLLAGISLIMACQSENETVDLSEVQRSAEFKRFDKAFFESDTTDFEATIDRLATEYPPFFTGGKNPVFWRAQRTDKQQIELYRETQKVFSDFSTLNENLNFSVKHYYYYFPHTPEIEFYTYISDLDFEYPVLYADSVCFAALDLYLGPGKPYYDQLPDYMAFYRQPAFLVRDILYEMIRVKLGEIPPGKSLIDDMIYHGKLLYALKQVMPQSEETIILQYTPEEMAFCNENERSMWAYFIENNYLFSTSQDLKSRFIELAPFSKFRMKFDRETPGMVGRWLGLQIVQAYADNNQEAELLDILKEQDSRKILKLSGYKP